MKFVIVGSGVAGMTAALDLARRDVGEIEIYTDEEYLYYYRPQLTEYLAGNITLDKLIRRPREWYAERGISFHLSSPVVGLDPENKYIELHDGTYVTYDRLLVATGSVPFTPPIKGADKNGVYTWRTLEDTLTLEKKAAHCGATIVVGGGLLGLEAARGLVNNCPNVTVLEIFPRLLPRQLDEAGSRLLQDFVESLGIHVEVGVYVEEIAGDAHVSGIRLKDGREFPAQLVVISAGVRCNTCFTDETDIEINRGIIVNEHMATSYPDIYAAGDVAVFDGRTWAIAPIAQAQGRVAAANMAGETMVYEAQPPSTSLKIVGIDVASMGIVNPEELEEKDSYRQINKLDEQAQTYKKIVLADDVIVGAIVINDKAAAKQLDSLVAKGARLTLEEAQALIN